MTQIYEKHLWGGPTHDFYSGEGSHHPEIAAPYVEAVTAFLKSHEQALTVCDLGCGDFNIGNQLVRHTQGYIAVDIVEGLIERNRRLYKADHLTFKCLDIAKDELPKADCVILRQVLQHLSNSEIQNIVNTLSHYQYLILTEHIPHGDFAPNTDIISGQGIRLKQNSGVDVLAEPFHLKIKTQSILNEFNLEGHQGRILTTLFELP